MPDGLTGGPAPSLPIPDTLLSRWFGERLGTTDVTIVTTELLPGGAIQHNWRVDLDADGAAQSYVLRAGPEIPLPESLTKSDEYDMVCRVYDAGIPVPEPLWFREGEVPFFVSRLCRGDARRGDLIARSDNDALLRDLGAALAQIHKVDTADAALTNAPSVRINTLSDWLNALDEIPGPISHSLADGLTWLRTHEPEEVPAVLVHRDFRTGNFLVENGRLTAVLDWEFAGWGDRHEDIGWFCARCWRGEAPTREAGGLGDRHVFYDAYIAAGGDMPDPERIRFWEVFAHLRWALIALQQGVRARAGAFPAWELEEAEARVPGLLHVVAEMTR
ncbi:MAG: phosphotransferase family protein [Alphaproteobacteria bacterium]